MATTNGSGTKKKTAAKSPAAKKRAPQAPKATVVPAETAPAPPQPAAKPAPDRLTEVARTIGSTVGAIAVTAKRALGHTAGKK